MQLTDTGPLTVRIPGPDVAMVDERPLYRFDGNPGQRSFVADLFDVAGIGRNQPADDNAERFLRPFMANALAAQFANITTTNVASLIPIQRSPIPATPLPRFNRPLWDAVTNGRLASSTSVTVPRVTAATGLAGEHVEGTNPSDGTFTVTADDDAVPKAISGQLTLNRELVDFAAPALVDLVAFGQMRAAWAEVVEARIRTMLDALAGVTAVTLNGTDDALASDWEDFLSALMMVRGGRDLTSCVLAGEMYAPTRAARDAAGARLYPVKAGGVLDLGGIDGVPAWALATANGGTGKSYLFDPLAVHAQEMVARFDFTALAVSKVVIAIWGHSAEWCTQPGNVRRLTYAAI